MSGSKYYRVRIVDLGAGKVTLFRLLFVVDRNTDPQSARAVISTTRQCITLQGKRNFPGGINGIDFDVWR